MPSTPWKGLVSDEDLIKESKKRKLKKITLAVDISKVKDYTGYEEVSRNRRKAKIEYVKSRSEQFEDQVWSLLYSIGFKQMNSGSDFGIPYCDNPNINPKQIDVFAYDGNVALVVECKSADCDDDAPSKPQDFKQELNEIRSYIDYQTDLIRKHFEKPELDVGFVFFTRKYQLGDANRALAEESGIALLNEFDMQYCQTLCKSLGLYAKYQILSDIFENKSLNGINHIVPAIRTNLPNAISMYTFLIEPSKLLSLAFVAHRKKNDHKLDKSYQRMFNTAKLKGIKKYVDEGGFFANNIIVNIQSDTEPLFETNVISESRYIDSDSSNMECGYLHLPSKYKSLWVIDGQHRLFGYVGSKVANTTVVPVTAFYNLDPSLQSKIFVDINDKQKRVDRNLLIDIESRSKYQSPQPKDWVLALNSIIFSEMSENPKSVFYKKLKNEYSPDSTGDITITSLSGAMNKSKLIGSVNQTFYPGPLFMDKADSREATKKKAMDFFEKVFSTFDKYCPEKWNCSKSEGGYLATPNGMIALIYTVKETITIVHNVETTVKMSAEALFEPMKKYIVALASAFNEMSAEEINLYKRRQGAAGQDICHKEMLLLMNKKYPEFTNNKIREYLINSDAKYTEMVKENLYDIEEEIIKHVKSCLENIDGPWYKTNELNPIGRELSDRRFNDGSESDHLEDFIDIDVAYRLIQAGGHKFFNKFERKSEKGKSFENRTSWINLFESIHKKVESNEKIMKNEADEFEKEITALQNKLGYEEANEID